MHFLLLVAMSLRGEELTMRNGYPVVNAYLNGKGPFQMLVDTGNESTLVTPEAAGRIGLEYTHRVVVASLGGEETAPAAGKTHVRVGSTERGEVEVIETKLSGVKHADARIDGILGQNFLGKEEYLIDFQAKRIWFGEEASRRAERMGEPLRAEIRDGRLAVPVRLGTAGLPFHLVLDSGASHLFVFCGKRCPRLERVLGEGEAITNGGNRRVERGLLREAHVGAVRFSKVEAALVADNAEPESAEGLIPARWFAAVFVDTGRREIKVMR